MTTLEMEKFSSMSSGKIRVIFRMNNGDEIQAYWSNPEQKSREGLMEDIVRTVRRYETLPLMDCIILKPTDGKYKLDSVNRIMCLTVSQISSIAIE